MYGGEWVLEMSDSRLVRKCLEGHTGFFEELVKRYKKLVYSIVLRYLRDRQDVYDASQEIFIRVYRSLSRYNPEYRFSTWVASISTNYCLDLLRKKRVDTVPVEEIEIMADDRFTPESAVIDMEKRKMISDAINELPKKYREPIVLFHSKGLSYQEISEQLRQPMSIVKNRIYRARHMLRRKLLPLRREEAL